MNPDQIGAGLLALVAFLIVAGVALDDLATWNRNRRTNRKATK